MSLIKDFIKQYHKEFDYYQKLSTIIANKIEEQLFKRGIKAIVTSRAKKPERLEEKLIKRNESAHYKTLDDIYRDIVDLSGIRVSLYFPSDKNLIDEIVREPFRIDDQKEFPNSSHTPKHNKRFSGYWATHYRVKLKTEEFNGRYSESIAEIQVASVLMHAWSEVEHDLVYKPLSGEPSEEEYAILDEINGLVLSGEIALERLQKAIAERTRKKIDITNKYELTNYLTNNINKDIKEKIKIGDTYLLNNYLNTTKKLNTKEFKEYIDKVDVTSNESVTDQLLNMLLIEFDKKNINLKEYFKNLKVPERRATGFESFIRCWIILETGVKEFYDKNHPETSRNLLLNFDILSKKGILTEDEIITLRSLRNMRNYLLHGIETPQEEYLKNSFLVLKEITLKVISQIRSKEQKSKLMNDLGDL